MKRESPADASQTKSWRMERLQLSHRVVAAAGDVVARVVVRITEVGANADSYVAVGTYIPVSVNQLKVAHLYMPR